MIDEKLSFRMIVFVLGHPRRKPGEGFGMCLKIFIGIGQRNRFLSEYIFPDLRNTETAFIVRPFIAVGLEDMRVDKNRFYTRNIIVLRFLLFIHIIKYLYG